LRHEVIGVLAPQLAHWRQRLNAAGLFEDLATAEVFLADREEKVRRGRGEGIYTAPDFFFVPVLLHRYTTPTPHDGSKGGPEEGTMDERDKRSPSG
jgi:hypothetical protein